jgi:hypothetical protein
MIHTYISHAPSLEVLTKVPTNLQVYLGSDGIPKGHGKYAREYHHSGLLKTNTMARDHDSLRIYFEVLTPGEERITARPTN